ncbi:MAG: hypothetical protein HOP31_06500 [Ignavibacteria bacterium]|nr:hypothetical protein [Ignavibacteria bacterium]
MKIFSISHDINVIKKNVVDFTKYYYQLQEFKQTKSVTTTEPLRSPVLDKAIDEKLTGEQYQYIFQLDREKFNAISAYFNKNDFEFYDKVLVPIIMNEK